MEREIVEIAEKINKMEFDPVIFNKLKEQFFEFARENNIKYGTKCKDGKGYSCANFEWTMCKEFFMSRFMYELDWQFIVGDVPRDIEVY